MSPGPLPPPFVQRGELEGLRAKGEPGVVKLARSIRRGALQRVGVFRRERVHRDAMLVGKPRLLVHRQPDFRAERADLTCRKVKGY